MNKRIKTVLRTGVIIMAAGLAYAVFCHFTRLAIPCVFHLVTGLKCPSCGITRQALALLRLDFATVWQENCMLVILSPLFALLGVSTLVQYLKTGSCKQNTWQKVLTCFLIAALLIFGVVRNICSL